MGEFCVLEDSQRRRKNAEFEVATRMAGDEISRVTRRFRQMRTLQQRPRGSYRGGNLDLFLPSRGCLNAHRFQACLNGCTQGLACGGGACAESPYLLKYLLNRCRNVGKVVCCLSVLCLPCNSIPSVHFHLCVPRGHNGESRCRSTNNGGGSPNRHTPTQEAGL